MMFREEERETGSEEVKKMLSEKKQMEMDRRGG